MTRHKKNRNARFASGEEVRIEGHVGTTDGPSQELHGEHGRVIAGNPEYRHAETGERMVSVMLGDGSLVSVPAKALKRS